MNDETTTVSELRMRMRQFVERRDWGKYHRPKNLAMGIAIEAAELMEHFQWLDHAEADDLLRDKKLRGQVADEMADIFAFLLSLANATGIDLSAAFRAKMTKNDRKYPAEKVRGHYQRSR